jgi:hypothetical protein
VDILRALVGTLTDAYRDARTGILYKFLQNGEGSNAIAEKVGCVRKGTADRAAFQVLIGGAGEGDLFAGVRVAGATSLAAGEWGWFAIRGGPLTFAGSTVTADTGVDLAASGALADAANDAAGAKGMFAVAEDAASGADAKVDVFKNAWGE